MIKFTVGDVTLEAVDAETFLRIARATEPFRKFMVPAAAAQWANLPVPGRVPWHDRYRCTEGGVHHSALASYIHVSDEGRGLCLDCAAEVFKP